jgi:hypothetical protein
LKETRLAVFRRARDEVEAHARRFVEEVRTEKRLTGIIERVETPSLAWTRNATNTQKTGVGTRPQPVPAASV